MLETFRAQGLIPRPRRAGYRGRAPVWRYPPGADRQLLALLGWREHTKEPDVLQVLLWIEGFPIPAATVRDALTRQLRIMIDAIDQEISRRARGLGLDPSDETARRLAVVALARTMAGQRGPTPLVRRIRMRASERTRAVALLVRVFGLGETVDGSAHDATLIENVLGIAPNGRRHSIDGDEPWLTGPAEDLFGAAGIVGLPRLVEVVAGASETELGAARQTVVALFQYLPLVVRMVGVMFGDDNYTGLAGLGRLDQQPEFVIYLVPMVMSMIKVGWRENLDTVTAALRPFPEFAAQGHPAKLKVSGGAFGACSVGARRAGLIEQGDRLRDGPEAGPSGGAGLSTI